MRWTATRAYRPRSTRRAFLTRAAGLAFGLHAARACACATGVQTQDLSVYDNLMTAFMHRHKPPGAALCVAYRGRLVYARGFGHADVEVQEPVEPDSLFRIASLSKPFTATAVLQLVDQGRLKLNDRVLPILAMQPHLEPGAQLDKRWHDITVLQCMQHTAGWDRDRSFDPMSAVTAEQIAQSMGISLPIDARQIIRYTMGKPLDHDPGTTYAYSNFGYCVLGRIIEAVAAKPYHQYVSENILAPLGIRRMRLGKNLLKDRAPGEVKYYDSGDRTGRAISGPAIGEKAPLPYGVECLETMDSNGGWIASAVDLVRFACALDDPGKCPILSARSLEAMMAAPPGAVGHDSSGAPRSTYYGCGWRVRPVTREPGKYLKWHTGLLAGSSALLVCRGDGVNWAVLFNCDATKDGQQFAALIDRPLHKAADAVRDWPQADLFSKL